MSGVAAGRAGDAVGGPVDGHVGDVVRPIRARVVRQDVARDHVVPLDELPVARTVPAPRAPGVPEDAYDDVAPGLYVYRLARGGEEHVAVVGDVAVEAFAEGRVRGHEAVQPTRVQALVDHWAAGGPRTALVALLHPPAAAVAAATARVLEGEPCLRFTSRDGWEQAVWRVPDADAAGLAGELGSLRHYVADGHHRVAASRAWHDAGRPDGAAVMCAMYPFGSLRVSSFHRRVRGPVSADAFWAAVSGTGAPGVEARPVPGPDGVRGVGLYLAGAWHDLGLDPQRPPGAGGLDVVVLDRDVLEPLLGDARHARVETAADVGDLAGPVAACDADGGLLLVLRPPTLDQLVEVADRGEVMPPKTTYFAPKPSAGLFLR